MNFRTSILVITVLLTCCVFPGQSPAQGHGARRSRVPSVTLASGVRQRQVQTRIREPRPAVLVPSRRDSPRQQGAQGHMPVPGQLPVVKQECRNIFGSIEQGISAGTVRMFSGHFADQVYVSLRGGESGYYSANQAFYLLDNYFKTRRLTQFSFTTISESESNPYATGSVGFNIRGRREYAQVYVSLSRSGGRWVITQMNIY